MAEDLLREVGVFKMEECLADLSWTEITM